MSVEAEPNLAFCRSTEFGCSSGQRLPAHCIGYDRNGNPVSTTSYLKSALREIQAHFPKKVLKPIDILETAEGFWSRMATLGLVAIY